MGIPVVALTTSKADSDIRATYDAHANCYITEPFDMDHCVDIVNLPREFWFTVVKLPANDAEL